MFWFVLAVGAVSVLLSGWEVYRADKKKSSQRRALWTILTCIWLVLVATHIVANDAARDSLTAIHFMLVLLGTLLRDILYDAKKAPEGASVP